MKSTCFPKKGKHKLFTKRRFLNFAVKQQHKKCAELLKIAYEGNFKEYLEYYNELLAWLSLPPFHPNNKKDIADAYHRHLGESDVCFKEHNLLPSIRKGDLATKSADLPIDIYLDQIRSGHNVGSIIRTTEAFSLGKLYFSDDTPFIDNKKVIDAAMDAHHHVQSFQNIPLKKLTRPIIVLETSENAVSLYDFIFPEKFTLVVGNEEYGCREETLRVADYILEIPLRGHKNSLNVANAFAIVASEVLRQRPAFFD